MVKKKAVIESGIVVNVILADDDFTLEGKLLVDAENLQIGDEYGA